jgi:hypothetical protein
VIDPSEATIWVAELEETVSFVASNVTVGLGAVGKPAPLMKMVSVLVFTVTLWIT